MAGRCCLKRSFDAASALKPQQSGNNRGVFAALTTRSTAAHQAVARAQSDLPPPTVQPGPLPAAVATAAVEAGPAGAQAGAAAVAVLILGQTRSFFSRKVM